MKKILLSILALGVGVVATAQSSSAPAANAVLVSQTRNGNTIVSRYKIPHNDGKQASFDVHYAINKSNVVASYSDNPQQMDDLKDFMAQAQDSTMHISAIHIVGYASPDGNTKQNDSLASHRAQSLYQYAVNTYHPTKNIDTTHKTFLWKDCASAVEQSAIPHKQTVLAILTSTKHTEQQKEAALRQMKDSWRYLAANILPQMRYADIEFDYGVDEFVTRTTTVQPTEPAKPATNAQQTTQPEVVVVDEEMGIIVATPSGNDAETRKEKREDRKSQKANKRGVASEYEVVYW